MSDLISRKAVYEMLHGLGGCDASDEWSNGWDKAIDSAIKELDKIPTAYDVDKIVEQLENIRENRQYDAERSLRNGNEFMEYGYNCEISGIDKAIYIIKGGGQGE